ncbi:DUF4334 domain-containing protein [Nocardia ignorata]|uniref:DUF4334 domain-containing protein n=1 Tax=Nocardia ignorata TaxID=145285 RepID=UPI0036339500
MSAADRLAALEPACPRDDALALFDSLPPVAPTELTGRWHGRELATGHRLDGLLAASGWYGKQFDGPDNVHPLLFATPRGDIFPVDPKRIPLGLVDKIPTALVEQTRRRLDLLAPTLRTARHRARLREINHRGTVTTAMIYDHLPIIDTFRRVDPTTVLGIMDYRRLPDPYFFILTHD